MTSRFGTRARAGYVMITMLWVMTVASVVALAASLTARDAVNATRNRVQAERAYWTAAGCARRAQSIIDALLRGDSTPDEAGQRWQALDLYMNASPVDSAHCDVRLEAAGTRLDVNSASPEMLSALFDALSIPLDDAGALRDALLDWRDSDDVARPLGAEREWYGAAERREPRNGDLADVHELALVRGFERLATFDSVLDVVPGRIALNRAPAAVLRALPGITRETADLIVALRGQGVMIRDPIELSGQLSQASTDTLMARYPDIVRLSTAEPDAWILTVSAWNGYPASRVSLIWRLGRNGARCVVEQTRSDL